MNTRSLMVDGPCPSQPSESTPTSSTQRFLRHFSQLKLSDQLSLVLASALGLVLSVILSPLILAIGLWQGVSRLMGK